MPAVLTQPTLATNSSPSLPADVGALMSQHPHHQRVGVNCEVGALRLAHVPAQVGCHVACCRLPRVEGGEHERDRLPLHLG